MSIETKPTIQERMQIKAERALDEVESQIDKLMDKKKTSFSMYNYLTKLEYSGKVVKFMKGFTQDIVYEIKNEESCEQIGRAHV